MRWRVLFVFVMWVRGFSVLVVTLGGVCLCVVSQGGVCLCVWLVREGFVCVCG